MFNHWLAGFIDGEGCFSIMKRARKDRYDAGYYCRFQLQLRDDDGPILEEIVQRTGIGYVTYANNKYRFRAAIWEVAGKQNCLALVQLLDKASLRAKKARDFEIWRQAVEEWMEIKPLYHNYKSSTNGQFLPRRPRADWSKIAQYKRDLSAIKEYNS